MIILNTLQIELPKGWVPYKNETDDELPAFINDDNYNTGVLQISYAKYISGKLPNIKKRELIKMSYNACAKNDSGKFLKKESGNCKFGTFGSTLFTSKERPAFKFWYLHDGRNCIMISYINVNELNNEEIKIANSIVENIKKCD